MKRTLMFSAALLMPVSFALAQQPPDSMPHPMAPMQIQHAIAVVQPASGSSVHGTVTFEATEKGMHIVANIEGLTPGKHGFHVHEFGDCSAADASSAGGHFNPEHKSHGGMMDMERHAGDLGNLTADATGKAQLDWVNPMMSFSGPHSIIGRAVVVHANEDDLKTQPAGNSGLRLACGVIGLAK
jgi:Cu-Zn family superoxide dismutase